jgi:anti-sigma regulatory factor (Ser/Thr protein kinase)
MLAPAVHRVFGSALEWTASYVQPALRLMKKNKVEFSSHTGNLAAMFMVLGVDEACTNIIRHAYHLRDDQLISLSLEGLRHCIRVRLRDYGRKTERHKMQGRAHDLIKPGGLGMHLIRHAFDKVDYVLKARGTELVMTKKLEI